MLQGFRTETNIARLQQIINLIKEHYSIDLSTISPDDIFFCDNAVRGSVGLYTGWLFVDDGDEYSIECWQDGRRHNIGMPAIFSYIKRYQINVLFSGWFKDGHVHRVDGYAKQWIDISTGIDYSSSEYVIDGYFIDSNGYWNHPAVTNHKLESILSI